ncbi:hypothetical protein [Staphylococcus pasteuri]|uniref:hypothetical protein n=1 Tax=Staphylococcus pasteuri TaxID=45972 RepID=UPI000E369FD2|nr:hypothetical protein [Staphylococcus pasteuri]RFD70720.1 hypothetical protein A7974_00380 [Staphylococcus pasteuri]
MSKSKLYFYITLLLLAISFFFNTNNPFLNNVLGSFVKLIIACSVINVIVLIISIIFADKSIKHSRDKQGWIRIGSKLLPFIILTVIIIHIVSSLNTYGFLS